MGVIDQLSSDEKKIWHTYLCLARKITRASVDTLGLPGKVRTEKTDLHLECYKECLQPEFYQSINSINFSIFTAEFRINLAARMKRIYNRKLAKFIDENDTEKRESRFFEKLSHYLKWRNFPSVCNLQESKEYLNSIKRLKPWIAKRNDIVHANYPKINKSRVIPEDALNCYEAVVDSIFELNIILGADRKKTGESKKEVSLLP
jgi:hypothetical protein